MNNDDFEWDEEKAAANAAKHAVNFETARRVFSDPFGVELFDDRADYGEDRYNVIGIVDGRVLVVTFTPRGDLIRIISARGAEPHERRLYHEEND
jgi:uncharacterized protein